MGDGGLCTANALFVQKVSLWPVVFFSKHGQSMIEHFLGGAEMAALNFLLDNSFLFRFEGDGHKETLTARSIGFNEPLSPFYDTLTGLHRRMLVLSITPLHLLKKLSATLVNLV
jgi:hypothetical protein